MLLNASEDDKHGLLETKNDLMELVNLMNEDVSISLVSVLCLS